MPPSYDCIAACGLLHLRVPRWNRWAWDIVRAMVAGCTTAVAFTMPIRGAGHPPVLAAVDPRDWSARLHTLPGVAGVEVRLLEGWGDAAYYVRKHRPRHGR